MFKRKNRVRVTASTRVEIGEFQHRLTIGDLRDFVEATSDWPEEEEVADAFQGVYTGRIVAERRA